MHVVAVKAAILDRGHVVVDLGQVALGELISIDNDGPTPWDVGQVRLQRGRVHRDQDVRRVPRCQDDMVGEVELEARDAQQRALRRPDLCREVGKRGDVIAERGGLRGESVPGELHPITRVSCETNDNTVKTLNSLDTHACVSTRFRCMCYTSVYTS